MLTEKDLLLDIMSKLPNNSKWHISKNSWDKIPLIFKNFDFNTPEEYLLDMIWLDMSGIRSFNKQEWEDKL